MMGFAINEGARAFAPVFASYGRVYVALSILQDYRGAISGNHRPRMSPSRVKKAIWRMRATNSAQRARWCARAVRPMLAHLAQEAAPAFEESTHGEIHHPAPWQAAGMDCRR